jgi:arabinofuranosyltransferase
MSARARLIIVAGVAGLVVVVLIRTAWVSDDAYITFRTIEQWLTGHGPRWNAGERVQAYSHPLWFLLLTPLTALSGDPYYAAIGLAIACSVGFVVLLMRSVAGTAAAAVLSALMVLASRALLDFSTSGLENPMTNLLLVLFLIVWWQPSGPDPARRALRMTFLSALLLTNRLDAGLLIAPALVVTLLGLPRRLAVRVALVGMLPFLLWEAFSLLYYGALVPNPAYAKLATGIPARALIEQGVAYFRESLNADPVTLPACAVGLLVWLSDRRRTDWPLALGLLFMLAYVCRVGGDFMSGRFFVAPFVVSAAMIVRRAGRLHWIPVAVLSLVVIGAGLRAPRIAALSGGDYAEPFGSGHGIQDERGYYYPATGLLRPSGRWQSPADPSEPRQLPQDIWIGRVVAVQDSIGLYGFRAPRLLHIVDVLGLGDPFLSRLPAKQPWRIGHFYRHLPDGYIESVETRSNRLRDPALARYYDHVLLVVRGPLLSPARLKAIVALNLSGLPRPSESRQ